MIFFKYILNDTVWVFVKLSNGLNFPLFVSYSDAIQKLEQALKTEPKHHFYVVKAKGQICHCHRMVCCIMYQFLF